MRVSMLFGGVLLLAITACSSSQKSFNNMTEEELYTYNLDKPLQDQVICQERRRSGSRIRNDVCMTYREMTSERSKGFQKLNVLNHRAPIMTFSRAHR